MVIQQMSYHGIYTPINPKKYLSKHQPPQIVYRSLWERFVMEKIDLDPNVVNWASEEISIPYLSPKDGRMHRYFPDFVITVKQSNGSSKTIMLEIKPSSQTKEPKPPKNKKSSKRYLKEIIEWNVNQAKWSAALNFCNKNNCQFMLITENQLPKEFR